MNIIFQNQTKNGDAVQSGSYTEYGNAGKMHRSVEAASKKQADNRKVQDGAQLSFSVAETNLNLISRPGSEKETEKKSLMDIQQEAAYTDVGITQDYMTLMSNTMSAEDYHKMSEEGFDFGTMDPDQAVTIVDKIKAELVRSGQQIAGYTDDLDMETLSAAVGSDGLARALADSFREADIPLTEENTEAVVRAWDMVQKLEAPSDGTYRYMIDNQLEPEIWNFYLAQSSGAGYAAPGSVAAGQDMSYLTDEGIRRQLDQVIVQAGREIDEENRESAKWLLTQGLPLTEESLGQLEELRSVVIPVAEEVFANAAVNAVGAGKDPIHASLAVDRTESIHEKAVEILEYYQSEDAEKQAEQLSSRKQLEEVRFRMTAEVNVRLLKSGFSIDTAPMEQMIEALREAEQAVAERYFPQDMSAVSKYENWNQTNAVIKEIPQLPAQLLGTLRIGTVDGENATVLARFHEEGVALRQSFEKAGESYESLMTAPRADLGDSMRKAFGNVEDLAREVGLEPVEENYRAIRILGYNHMEITPENVERVKDADTRLSEIVQKMTPAATLQMIRDGVNPLEQSFDELNAYFDKLPEDFKAESESYSRYLYGLERNQSITEEERESYIGVYRLLHQIEKKDGAAIGAVINTQAELQFSNLLAAVRSGKFRHMDVKASDEYGVLKELVQKGEGGSISEQISRAYEQTRLQEFRSVATTETAVTQLLERGETAVNAENLLAAGKILSNADNPFKILRKKASDPTGRLWESLADKESFRTEYDETITSMQEEAEEFAFSRAESSLDVRAMQLAHRQLAIMGNLSRREEYFLPMEVGGEESLVHLTLENGNKKKGEISITVDLSGENRETGHIEAHLQVKNDRIEGFLVGNTAQEVTKLQGAADIFYDLIREDNYGGRKLETAKLAVVSNENNHLNGMYRMDSREDVSQETVPTESDTPENEVLYHVAKLFLQAIR